MAHDEDETAPRWGAAERARAQRHTEVPEAGALEHAIKRDRSGGAFERLMCPRCLGNGYLLMTPARRRPGDEGLGGEELEGVG